jgi:hypothetical protein
LDCRCRLQIARDSSADIALPDTSVPALLRSTRYEPVFEFHECVLHGVKLISGG